MADSTMGQRIAAQRKRLNLSQEALGEKMGVSRQAISKWESDGAVPEIDKLIAMSRLFGVSVGWLLGVEENNELRQEETFSERQLALLEELFRGYRQPETPSKKPWILTAVAICAVLILGLVGLSRLEKNPDYTGQISSLSSSYQSLQSQLWALSGQLEELARGERLLTEYEFTGVPLDDPLGVRVTLTATPRQWQPGDRAELSVRRDGTEFARVPCEFDGSTVTAHWDLPADTGFYSYCFIRCHADGLQEQQILNHVWLYAQEPLQGLRVDWQGSFSWTWEGMDSRLTIDHVFAHVNPPELLYRDKNLRFTKTELCFLLDGEEHSTIDLLQKVGTVESKYHSDGTQAEESLGGYISGGFWPEDLWIKVPDGSRVEAVLTVEFTGGCLFQESVGAWVARNGTLEEEYGR